MNIPVACGSCGSILDAADVGDGGEDRCPRCRGDVGAPSAEAIPPEHPDPATLVPGPPRARLHRLRVILAATLVGGVGALAWALVTRFVKIDISWVAWAMGVAIGYAIVKVGGGGPIDRVYAAAWVALAIMGGRYLAYTWEAGDMVDRYASPARYEEGLRDGEMLAYFRDRDGEPLTNPSLVRFLFLAGYIDETERRRQNPETLDGFRQTTLPYLTRLHDQKPDYETWREVRLDELEVSFPASLRADFDEVDVVFLVLGMASAFLIVSFAQRRGSGGPA